MGLEFACLRHYNQLGGNRACECEELCQLNCLLVISIACCFHVLDSFFQLSFVNVPNCWSPRFAKLLMMFSALPHSHQFDFPIQLIAIVS
jgi:hypothetical protein